MTLWPTRTCPSARLNWLVFMCAGAGFVAITLAAASGVLLPADEAVLAGVAARRDCASIAAATALSFIGAGEVSLLITALLVAGCLVRRAPRAAAALLILYLSLPIELGLKHLLAQPLPGTLFPIPGACEWYHPSLSVMTPHSYPSGYAIRVTYFFALAAAWLLGGQTVTAGHGYPTRQPFASVLGERPPSGRPASPTNGIYPSGWPAYPAGGARRGPSRLLLGVGLALVLVLLIASRLVLSWHWPSDLVGGGLLGLALAAATGLAAGHAAPR